MKNLLTLLIVLVLNLHFSSAQTWAEWFDQQSTQKKYLMQQLLTLEVLSSTLKQGYQLVQSRTDTAAQYGQTESRLHQMFYRQRLQGARRDTRIELIAQQHDKLSRLIFYNSINQTNTNNYQKYLSISLLPLMQRREELMDTYAQILKSFTISASESDRSARLQSVYESLQHELGILQSFYHSLWALRNSIVVQSRDAAQIKMFYR